jgi:hypothetical protein
MKNFRRMALLAIAGVVAFASSANAQCKVEDVIEKYKSDNRCNSVNMSKAMLNILMKQRGFNDHDSDLKNLNVVKILSVKIPKNKVSTFIMGPNDSFYFDTDNMTLETKTGRDKEAQEKLRKEKKLQKEAEQKRMQEEYKDLGETILKEANACIDAAKYTEMMSVNDNGKKVKYYAMQEGEKIKEFIVITQSSKENSLILIKGSDIQISSLGQLSGLIPSADIDIDLY